MLEVGIFIGFSGATPADEIVAMGQAVEARGFHCLWVPEHVLFFKEYASRYPYSEDGRIHGFQDGMLDPFIALTFLAANTQTIRLGTSICLVPQREPIYTAKQIADIDFLSGGRVNFGVGIGWLKEEFDALGIDFKSRAKRTRECFGVMKALWTQEESSYSGDFFQLPECLQFPKPVQKPHPPIFFGGESDAALRRVAQIGQGWMGAGLMPDALASRLTRLDELLAEAGRSRKDVKIYVMPNVAGRDPDRFKQYEELGVEQVIHAVGGRGLDEFKLRLDVMAKAAGITA
ncbi:MAG: LLM class F420-dependent oxidoreductase [Pseudomonadales bacterium]|nr:LLM class F420-dependent oxidoreductase [Pseudomonadales bacterium]